MKKNITLIFVFIHIIVLAQTNFETESGYYKVDKIDIAKDYYLIFVT